GAGDSILAGRPAPIEDLLHNARPATGAQDAGAYAASSVTASPVFFAPDPVDLATTSLLVTGGAGDDTITIARLGANIATTISNSSGTNTYTFPSAYITGQIRAYGSAGNDILVQDATAGALQLNVGFDGGAGTDTWQFMGGSYSLISDVTA